MNPDSVANWAEILKAGSPWVMLIFMGYFIWHMQHKRDVETKATQDKLIQLVENQTSFLIKVENALTSLRNSIDNFIAHH